MLMLHAEQLELMPDDGERWQCLDEVDESLVKYVRGGIRGLIPHGARAAWLGRFAVLTA